MSIAQRLNDLKIELPTPPKPVANYLPFIIQNKIVYISGQLPMQNGQVKYTGIVGKDISIDEAQKAAELCAINILAQLKSACEGDLEKVIQCIKIGVFVASIQEFTSQPAVANFASNLIANVFGDKGKHARFAVGSSSLPLNASVEIEAVFAIN